MTTLAGNLRVNLVVKATPMRGLRWWIAARLLAFTAWVFGGKLVLGVEPEFTIATIESRRK